MLFPAFGRGGGAF